MSSKIASWESQGNKHILLNAKQRALPYHTLIADLVIEHSKEHDKILDVGCGLGQLCCAIKEKGGRQIHAADAYQACLDKTQSIVDLSKAYLIEEKEFNIKNAIDDRFSVVVMSHVLEHMYNPVQAVKDVLELVDDGGYLILAVPNPARPGVLLGNMVKSHYVNVGHVVCWDPSHWINFLENIMELDVKSYHHDFIAIKGFTKFPLLMDLGILMGKMIPWWCFSNIAVIQKR